MVFSPFPGFGPLTRVSAFTHRDNATYLRILEELVKYINETLADEWTAEIQSFLDQFNTKVNEFITTLNSTDATWHSTHDAFVALINSTVAAFESSVNSQISTFEGTVNTQLTTMTGDIAAQSAANATFSANMTAALNAQLAAVNALLPVLVPQPGYDIVILAGQSNMSGRGTAFSSALDPVNPLIFEWGTHGTLGIKAAVEPLDMHDTASGIGPGLQFARWYASRALATGRKILLVPVAHGGTPLVSAATLGWRRGVAGGLYANMITQTQAALTAAGTGSRVVACLWLQGETDGDNLVTTNAYQTDFDALINGLRTDLAISDLPFIVGTMVPEYLTTGTRAGVNAVHRDTPNRILRTDVAVSAVSMNNADGNHFNAPGQRFNGRAFFDAFERVSEGLAPYAEAHVIPAQVTGVTVGTITGTSVAFTWTAVSGSTKYIMEYRTTAGAGAWLAGPIVTGTAGTFGGLTPATAYDFRISAGNTMDVGTPSATANATTGVMPKLFGITTPAANAYSLRKIGDTYGGSAVKVRRSSDNATLDIGFTGTDLDTAALLAFTGAGDGFVDTWYDQSGNNRHISQTADTTAQPKIVATGSVVTSGGKPAVIFDGVNDVLSNTAPALYAAGAATVCEVLYAATPTGQLRSWTESKSVASGEQYGLLQPDGGSGVNKAYPVYSGVTNSAWTPQPTIAFFNGAIHQGSAVDTGSAMSQWIDGLSGMSAAPYVRAATTKDRFNIGGAVRSGSLAALPQTFSEFAAWGSVLGTTDRQAAETSQKTYYGTP